MAEKLAKLNVRQFRKGDAFDLDAWKTSDPAVKLETPHGYLGEHVETAVVTKGDEKVLSLTANVAVVLDPLIKNPNATVLEIMEGLVKAEAALAFVASKIGALDIYISVPEDQRAYHRIIERFGYSRILDGCVVFKKALVAPVPSEPASEVKLEEPPAPAIEPEAPAKES